MMIGKYMAIWLLFLLINIDPGDIAVINELKKKAQEAYEDQDYVTAAYNYQVLIDSLGVTDPAIKLNLAHCYFNLDNETDAINYYRNLCAEDVEEPLRSVAYQQLGVINASKNELKVALEDFKAALRANPANEDARYNYEVVKRKLKEEEEKKEEQKQDQQKQDQKQDQQKQDQKQDKENEQSDDQQQQQKEQEQQDKEKEEQEQKENQQQQEQQQSEDEKRKQQEQQQQAQNPEIDRARAEQILKSMQEQEKQYFQQLKKKGQKKGKSGPDW